MKNSRILLVLLYLCLCAYPHQIAAQTPDSIPQQTVIYNQGRYNAFMKQVFYNNMPHHFQAPALPRFAVTGHERNFYLGIGGYIRTIMAVDFNDVIDQPNDFITSLIPIPGRPGNKAKTHIGATTSNLFLNLVGLPNTPMEFGTYIDVEFSGPHGDLELQYAYVSFYGFTLGYNNSLFTDADAMPPTIDAEGPCAATFVYRSIIAYRQRLRRGWSVALSLENPHLSATPDLEQNTLVYQRVPDIPLYVKKVWGQGNSLMQAAAIFRTLTYRNEVAQHDKSALGWGVKLSGVSNFGNKLITYYQGVFGKGIAQYIQDIQDMGLDLVTDPARPGRMSTVKLWGAYGCLQYLFTPTTFVSCTYSQNRLYYPRNYIHSSEYLYAQYLSTNFCWNIHANIQMGVEYLWGRRVNQDKQSNTANRIQALLQFVF